MQNYILRIMLKNKEELTIADSIALMRFWNTVDIWSSEFRQAVQIAKIFG